MKHYLFIHLFINLLILIVKHVSSKSIISNLKDGFIISLDKPKHIELHSYNLIYRVELMFNQSYELIKDESSPGNEYFILDFDKTPLINQPLSPNSTFNFSEYGKNWKQNLTVSKGDLRLPMMDSSITELYYCSIPRL